MVPHPGNNSKNTKPNMENKKYPIGRWTSKLFRQQKFSGTKFVPGETKNFCTLHPIIVDPHLSWQTRKIFLCSHSNRRLVNSSNINIFLIKFVFWVFIECRVIWQCFLRSVSFSFNCNIQFFRDVWYQEINEMMRGKDEMLKNNDKAELQRQQMPIKLR